MARPKRTYEIETIGIKLTLIKGEDDDLIALLRQTPLRFRALTVKSALRGNLLSGMQTDLPSSEDGSAEMVEALDGFVL